MEPPLVSEDEKDRAITRLDEFMQRAGRVRVDLRDVIPVRRPLIQHLTTDDDGNVWVQRQGDDEGTTLFEQFSSEGRFLGQYVAPYVAHQFLPPTIRRGWLLAVQIGEFDVQSVVGFRLDGS